MIFDVGFAEFFYVNQVPDRVASWPSSGVTQSWTPPAGVYWVWVKACAGGGGGGTSVKSFFTTGGGGGGGAGESVEGVILQVTPGIPVPIYVGGGGPGGYWSLGQSKKVHVGPESNLGTTGSGWGGENTIIGPLVLNGGFGGLDYSAGHGGCGGGPRAGLGAGGFGAGGANNGDRITFRDSQPGFNVKVKDNGRYWAGSGGACSGTNGSLTDGAGIGGGQGPFVGGAEGLRSSGVTGGAGGGASAFGNGGNGGNGNSNAPAVGAFGVGGGGGGGCSTLNGFTIPSFFGAYGGDGYVSLHYLIITP